MNNLYRVWFSSKFVFLAQRAQKKTKNKQAMRSLVKS